MKNFTMPLLAATFLITSSVPCFAGKFDGNYTTKTGRNIGDLTVTDAGAGKYHFAFLNTWKDHSGELEFDAVIDNNGNGKYVSDNCSLKLKLSTGRVKVKQDFTKGSCDAGENVVFDGVYKKK